jgi:hypothetical protein
VARNKAFAIAITKWVIFAAVSQFVHLDALRHRRYRALR